MNKKLDDTEATPLAITNRRDALKAGAAGAALAAVGLFRTSSVSGATADDRVSALGVYRGYSNERFDAWKRTSQYVAVRDGTRLAVDIFRPTIGSVLHSDKLPVIWTSKRYQRATVNADGTLQTIMDSYYRAAGTLIKHGYIIAAVDRRGTGASFGTTTDLSDPNDSLDGYDITEWFAKQPWCSGNVGMFGASYEGEVQLRVAGSAPPHLKAIMPEVSPFDWYWIVHPGGTEYRVTFGPDGFAAGIHKQDLDTNNAPVDEDADRSLLTAALAGHKAGNNYAAPNGELPYRDSVHPVTGKQEWLRRHGGHYTDGISKSGIAVYHRVGWFAGVMLDQWAWYVNQKSGPKKMLIGPWGGRGVELDSEHELWNTEALRFYDYWLKGIKNGIMDEAPIHSSVPSSHTRNGTPWREIWEWPLPNQERTDFFFDAGPTGSIGSVNDGLLTKKKPSAAGAKDNYTVKFDLLYGKPRPRFPTDPASPGVTPADHSSFDKLGLTYTTAPLDSDLEVTGHPFARLWVTSSAPDGDFFVKLQDVDEHDVSTYVTDGTLRASERALGKAPYMFFDLPWSSNFKTDIKVLPAGKPVEIAIWMNPLSYIFQKSHRIRVTVTGSDLAIAKSPVVEPAPIVSLHRSLDFSSCVNLPVIPGPQTRPGKKA
jgi:putative CocE/NonD family hydrolase